MIVVAVFGLFLGLYEIAPLVSSGVVVGVSLLRALLDLQSTENFITKGPTSYTRYKQNLEKRETLPFHPWRRYLKRKIGSEAVVGLAVYGAALRIAYLQ